MRDVTYQPKTLVDDVVVRAEDLDGGISVLVVTASWISGRLLGLTPAGR